MGSVWVGRHLGLDVPIAIKFMSLALDAQTARARFDREARALASLRSPHVVQVLDCGSAGDAPFIVMELLEGEDLGQRLARASRLELSEVSDLVTQLAKGLELAHDAGIVHRDLKPSNVFLARVGNDEIVKILDFGVAKETRLDAPDTETTTGTVVGSPSYMSPEQARGGRIDKRSDLWSLAVVIFQALTGQRPFAGPSLGDVLVRICTDPLPIATKLAPGLPPAIDVFFERALCRSPDGRFPDAGSLARALAAVASGAPVPAIENAVHAPEITAPRLEATGSIVAHPDDVPTRREDAAPIHEETAAGIAAPAASKSASITMPARGSSRAGALWGLGGAAVVAALWGASRAGWLGGGDASVAQATQTTEAPAAVAASSPAAPEITISSSSSTALASAPAPSASVVATDTSASAAPAVARPPPGARWRPPARPGTEPAVDPKFGLPGGR